VQQFSACLGVVALFVALVTAPLFHSHDHNDHGDQENQGGLVHAHFLDAEAGSHHAESHHRDYGDHGDEIAAADSHHEARWINFFTLHVPAAAFVLAVEFSERIALPTLEESESTVLYAEPRAHSPPDRRGSSPRSPPAI